MKRIAFVLYRSWAYDIFQNVNREVGLYPNVQIPLLITTPEMEFRPPTLQGIDVITMAGNDQNKLFETLKQYDINTAFFYGWSWIVKEPIISDFTCVCLHPSALPQYRGGSPIQNQIIAGETQSAVSIIKMSVGIDDGDLYTQIPFDLKGYLPDILGRITEAGTVGTKQYLADLSEGVVKFIPQTNLDKYPPLKRRSPAESVLSLESLKDMTYMQLYNLVRGLQTPYPMVDIKNGEQHLLVEKLEYSHELPDGVKLLSSDDTTDLHFPLGLKLSDGFALVTKGQSNNI
ncbi:hypothetical protein H6789_02995 [Candidatus Nomurabacteria bacterium]|nr:hypothetical protein [Candidatus Nomurabacteria bacterium]